MYVTKETNGAGREYLYGGNCTTPMDCMPVCKNLGTTLATVITADDAANFQQLAVDNGIFVTDRAHSFIIGLHDDAMGNSTEGIWRWDDGTVEYNIMWQSYHNVKLKVVNYT